MKGLSSNETAQYLVKWYETAEFAAGICAHYTWLFSQVIWHLYQMEPKANDRFKAKWPREQTIIDSTA